MAILRILALAFCVFAAACATSTTSGTSVGPPPAAPSPMAWDVRIEGRTWTATTMGAIDALAPQLLTTLPADIDAFCPGYRTASPANRRAFYTALLAELSRYESNFEPSTRYQEETIRDRNGRPVISRGLLQISMESANGYGCGITSEAQLHDATVNLQCGVRILGKWVTQDQLIAGYNAGAWRGASRYWSPFRDRTKLADLQAALNALPYCRRPR